MDPVSAIFAAYLDVVSASVPEHASGVPDTGVQAIYAEHKGIKIPYTFQQWKINPDSVCNTYASDNNTYSECAVAAKSFFSSVCNYLGSNPSVLSNHLKQKNMYCSAAIDYEPDRVNADWSQASSPLPDARSECNLAIAGLMRDRSLAAQIKKDQACGKYAAIMARQAGN